mmetsp:Transcript_51066/g.110903  ORF Transcript_51066/g.110903 Transcript_51066/m.110903 type:complete len:232 (-) Transcript_51066:1458-2153(-)
MAAHLSPRPLKGRSLAASVACCSQHDALPPHARLTMWAFQASMSTSIASREATLTPIAEGVFLATTACRGVPATIASPHCASHRRPFSRKPLRPGAPHARLGVASAHSFRLPQSRTQSRAATAAAAMAARTTARWRRRTRSRTTTSPWRSSTRRTRLLARKRSQPRARSISPSATTGSPRRTTAISRATSSSPSRPLTCTGDSCSKDAGASRSISGTELAVSPTSRTGTRS